MFFSPLLLVFKACDKGLVLLSLVAPREIFGIFTDFSVVVQFIFVDGMFYDFHSVIFVRK